MIWKSDLLPAGVRGSSCLEIKHWEDITAFGSFFECVTDGFLLLFMSKHELKPPL